MKYILIIIIYLCISPTWGKAVRKFGEKDFFRDKTNITDPFTMRDPFRIPVDEKEEQVDITKGTLRDGVYTNVRKLEKMPLKDLRIIGVFLSKDRRAIARVGEGDKARTVTLKEGMTLGKNRAELKAILPGGVVLVEKIINVYGQEEYLETIIPISK